jgi:hypothetical protein
MPPDDPIEPDEPDEPPEEGADEPDELPGCCRDELLHANKPSIATRLMLIIPTRFIRVIIVSPAAGACCQTPL